MGVKELASNKPHIEAVPKDTHSSSPDHTNGSGRDGSPGVDAKAEQSVPMDTSSQGDHSTGSGRDGSPGVAANPHQSVPSDTHTVGNWDTSR